MSYRGRPHWDDDSVPEHTLDWCSRLEEAVEDAIRDIHKLEFRVGKLEEILIDPLPTSTTLVERVEALEDAMDAAMELRQEYLAQLEALERKVKDED